jgi:hypothetical protein
MKRDQYIKGDPYVWCQSCGWRKHFSEVAKQWDNLIVCREKCWEPYPSIMKKIPHFPNEMKPVPNPRPKPAYRDIVVQAALTVNPQVIITPSDGDD